MKVRPEIKNLLRSVPLLFAIRGNMGGGKVSFQYFSPSLTSMDWKTDARQRKRWSKSGYRTQDVDTSIPLIKYQQVSWQSQRILMLESTHRIYQRLIQRQKAWNPKNAGNRCNTQKAIEGQQNFRRKNHRYTYSANIDGVCDSDRIV